MNENFYYFASYTAALAAGLTEEDAGAVARAVRFAESYTADGSGEGDAASPAKKAASPGVMAALHYLPGDRARTMAQADPRSGNAPGMRAALSLVSGPDGSLSRRAAGWARERWRDDEAHTGARQAAGIVLHALADACLHRGFAGVASETVNAAGGILTAKEVPPEQMRQLLGRDGPLSAEDPFELEPYAPEDPPSSFLGCAQLGALAGAPGRIFTYQSPWRAVPTVSWVGPSRFAGAYLVMKEALAYIRRAKADFEPPSESSDEARGLALSFSGFPSDESLPEEWWQPFAWCRRRPCDHREPVWETDRDYIDSFDRQLFAFRDLVWDACPALRRSAKRPETEKTGGLV